MRFFIWSLTVILCAATAQAETLRMAVTTSFYNSGLSDILLPEIEADIDVTIELLVVGTGQALRLGEAGDVDAILVHSRVAEEKFLTAGFGTHRREIMYNDFVFIGPDIDPAGIAAAQTATDALMLIAGTQQDFVSRGDDSGTHKKELSLWQDINVHPIGDWYREAGSGMGATLNVASGMNAYVMADRASWLNFGNKADLRLLFSGDPALFNQYAFIPVNPALHPHVKSEAVQMLENWLVSPRAAVLITDYKINGQPLFTFNAAP